MALLPTTGLFAVFHLLDVASLSSSTGFSCTYILWAVQGRAHLLQHCLLVIQFITRNNLLTGWLDCESPSQPSCQPQWLLLWSSLWIEWVWLLHDCYIQLLGKQDENHELGRHWFWLPPASSTGSLRCSCEFNSSLLPGCFLEWISSQLQSNHTDKQSGWMGSPVSDSFLHHGWAHYRFCYFTCKSSVWNMEEWNLITDAAAKAVAFGSGKSCFTFFWHGLCSQPVGNWPLWCWVCMGVTKGHLSCQSWCWQDEP